MASKGGLGAMKKECFTVEGSIRVSWDRYLSVLDVWAGETSLYGWTQRKDEVLVTIKPPVDSAHLELGKIVRFPYLVSLFFRVHANHHIWHGACHRENHVMIHGLKKAPQ
eukprot:1330453-Amorphochlora_amoeboformis.AAC.1